MKYLLLCLLVVGCSDLERCRDNCLAQDMVIQHWDSETGHCDCMFKPVREIHYDCEKVKE